MMSCEQFEEQVSAYIDHELSDDETEMLFKHLAGCASCRRAMTAVLDLRSGLRDRAPLLAPKELDDRVLRMARSAQLRMPDRVAIPAKMWQRRISMRISVAAAVMLTLLFVSFFASALWLGLSGSTDNLKVQTVFLTAVPTVEVRAYTMEPVVTIQ
jgi:anti-sigma factor RsiW